MQYFVHALCAICYRSIFPSFFLLLSLVGQTSLAQVDKTVDQTDATSTQQQPVEEAKNAPPAEAETEQAVPGESDPADPLANPVDMEKWKRRYRRYNTWEGSTGGMHLVDPLSGAAGSVRIQVGVKGLGQAIS